MSGSAVWQLRRWTWLVVIVAGGALFVLVRQTVHATGNPNLIPALLLLGATVVPVAAVSFVYTRDPQPDLGVLTVITVAVVGGVLGVVASAVLEYDTLRHLGRLPAASVAVIEEVSKLAVPAVVLALHRYGRPSDGLVLGVACGAGFAIMETLGYSAVELIRSHQDLGAVDAVLLERGLCSPATHIAWTGLCAAMLWRAADRRWSLPAVTGLVLALAVAVALHAAWDGAHTRSLHILIAAASVLGLLAAAAPAAPADSRHLAPRARPRHAVR